jgi:hypothetical protein
MLAPHLKTGEKPPILVILDFSAPKTLKKFHCPICGKVAFEYWDEIRAMVPGSPSDKDAHMLDLRGVIQCSGTIQAKIDNTFINTRCKAKFFI